MIDILISLSLSLLLDLILICFVAAVSQNSLYVTSKLAQITVERESGCLGLTLRGGADYPLIVTHVRLHGPVYKTGRIKPGDRLLRVDNVSDLPTAPGESCFRIRSNHSSSSSSPQCRSH